MFFSGKKDSHARSYVRNYLKNETFQRLAIGIATVLIAFVIVTNGAMPKKYKLGVGEESAYDITAPRDIENEIKTKENRDAAEAAVTPVTMEISTAVIEVLNNTDEFFTQVESTRKSVEKSLQNQGISKKDKIYKTQLEVEQSLAANKLGENIKKLNIPLSNEQIRYLIAKTSDEDTAKFKKSTREAISEVMMENITEDKLPYAIDKAQNTLQKSEINQDLKNIGALVIKAVIKPNRTINVEATQEKKKDARNSARVEKILKDQRIISKGEKVTIDKYTILEGLNLIETNSRFDYTFAAGILIVLILLASILVLYMYHFSRNILNNKNDILLISVIILLTLGIARGVYEYWPLGIPIFLAGMLISILLDLKLAGVVNFILTIAILMITKNNLEFLYMSLISGTFAVSLVSKANQRSKLSMAGIITGLLNVLIIVCFGIINKSGIHDIGYQSIVVFLNGIVSIVLTIGTLPFWEVTFNIITPLKLLELANPNQPLIKRLLMEAPGTYHHSLMVGNLAEVATEAIGGNSLLARVGAYFHDVGKLKRPNFFKENQMSDNPHDRMTANLSTLVITSHTRDGLELALKYKIPLAIRNIISQHHGNTLVAYFYHKAKKGDKGDGVKQDNFRYEGPKPTTKEAAVVMLADSVEAAVRSMMDKTEGKIEGLVRKIIKDKLDDGQLDSCELTLKDLDNIAKGFMQVLSGIFHEREEYPEVKAKAQELDAIKLVDPLEEAIEQKQLEDGRVPNGNLN